MERREAVKYISVLLGGALVGGTAFLTGCKSSTGKDQQWTTEDIAYLDEIAETILPRTSTPGARDAQVGRFMTVMINDCYEEGDQKVFREGMDKLNEASKKNFNAAFMNISAQQRHQLLVEMDKEANEYGKKVAEFNSNENKKEKDEITKGNMQYKKQHMSPHYFTMMKQLTLLGFFTSEVGATQAMRYVPVPGRFEGCIPYKKGDKAFA
ncbi:MAG TPA: gluconate 2-dehydrogenase subunit 3 family protein [Chitinophagaceae bacterium]|nr:gluconate 2-dehydrogenase subunit 3 family protein [Chitinophagaceae bacterium]